MTENISGNKKAAERARRIVMTITRFAIMALPVGILLQLVNGASADEAFASVGGALALGFIIFIAGSVLARSVEKTILETP
jgi:hypothetical protein